MTISKAINEAAKNLVIELKNFESEILTALEVAQAQIGIFTIENDLSFETEKAFNMFESFVIGKVRGLNKEVYNMIHPPQYMDENGTYTSDASKWV